MTSLASRSVAGARVRPYGVDVADLEIDFDAPRPIVVTRLLAACLRGADDDMWSLPVQTRILLLLGISELSVATPVEVHLACGCGETAVIELSMAELASFAAERHRDELVVTAGEASARLRLPTGRDQLRWTQLGSSTDVVRDVISDLVVEGDRSAPDTLWVAADKLLSDADPLVELELGSACPACGTALARQVDLERIALTRLRNARRALLEQVHVLASTYHWTETTIAALPAWRRVEYATLARQR